MYKKVLAAILAGVLAISICATSFAADTIAKGGKIYTGSTGTSTDAEGNTITEGSPWIKTSNGNYQYKDTDGNILKDTITPDGYYVDENGNWNGAPNNALAKYPVIGKAVLKSNADAVIQDDHYYHFTVTLFDTAFFTEAEIKKIKKGDTVVLPGLNITTTALANGSSSKIVRKTDASGVSKGSTSSGAKVKLQDADGNTYTCSSKFTSEILTDGTTKALLRPVSTSVPMLCSQYRESRQASGTSQLTKTDALLTGGMYFTCTFKGNEVDELYDSPFNYNTSSFAGFSDDLNPQL